MKIKVIKVIRPEIPVLGMSFIPIKLGIYDVEFNKNGAASVRSEDGKSIGVKPDEFVFLSESDRSEWIRRFNINIPGVQPGGEDPPSPHDDEEFPSRPDFSLYQEILS